MSYSSLMHLPTLSGIRCNRLYAPHNYIRVIWPEMLPAGVEDINLSHNNILSDGLLEEWPENIYTINLSNNFITDLATVNLWPAQLRVLDLSYTPLKELPDGSAFPNLEWLSVSHTEIIRITSFPPRLRILDATTSHLVFISNLPDSLEVALLNENRFGNIGLPKKWSASLKTLSLSKNKLTQIPSALPDCLTCLNLSANAITEITHIPASLIFLSLEVNRIRAIPQWLTTRRHLNVLLEDNCITEYVALPHVLSFRFQWFEPLHHAAAVKIQRCWVRYRIGRRLSSLCRTARTREELLNRAMHPDRVGRFEDISSEWRARPAESANHSYSAVDKWTFEVLERSHSRPPGAREYR